MVELFHELWASGFITALLAIIIIDLVLAGDNALVIGMAARNLPKELQKKAIIWGTFGAILIRVLATLLVVWLLKIPGLMLIGGVLLIWISYKLLVEKNDGSHIKSASTLGSAIRTIVIADAIMGVDNMLAVAGAAHGNMILVIIGLLISVPIIVWGSTLVIKAVQRFPWIIYIGAGVLALTAGKMISGEKLLYFAFDDVWLKWTFIGVIIMAVLAAGLIKNRPKSIAAQG
jgi:YjbE family integral membrane protein